MSGIDMRLSEQENLKRALENITSKIEATEQKESVLSEKIKLYKSLLYKIKCALAID